jgi:hypothetical protein
MIQFPMFRALELSGETTGCFYYRLDNGRIKYAGKKGSRTIPADELERLLVQERETLTRRLADHQRRWSEFQQIVTEASTRQEGKANRQRARKAAA